MKYKIGDYLEIKWADSMLSSGWELYDQFEYRVEKENRDVLYCKSVGMFVIETKHSIIICSSISNINDIKSGAVCDKLEIPHEAIIKIRKLK